MRVARRIGQQVDAQVIGAAARLAVRMQHLEGLEPAVLDERGQPGRRRHLQPAAAGQVPARLGEQAEDVLRSTPPSSFPLLDRRPGDRGLQEQAVVMGVVPGAGRLVELADPQRQPLAHLEAGLEALEVRLRRGGEVFRQQPEPRPLDRRQHVAVDAQLVRGAPLRSL
ncbi:MAG: hypothetical protein U1F11_14955 [Steroidobacteraceae bacterium]